VFIERTILEIERVYVNGGDGIPGLARASDIVACSALRLLTSR
jgi:hypothetical protein